MTSQATPIADALKAMRAAMQAGQFDDAARQADALLADHPDNQDALYMAAATARYLGQDDRAFNLLGRLKRVAPDFGRAFQEEGHLHRKRGDTAAALTAYQRAVRYNPALNASWTAMAELHDSLGNPKAAAEARAQADRLKALPRELLAVTNYIHEGKLLQAERIARAFMQQNPKHIEGMRLLADIGTRLGVHEDADFLLETAIQLAPDNPQLKIDYIQVLRKRQKYEAALAQAEALLKHDPNSPVFKSLFAIESMQAGDYDTALAIFDDVLETMPDDLATLTSRGHALKTAGETDKAIASYKRATEVEPLHGDAWYALANLKTFSFSDADIDAMLRAKKDPNLSYMGRIHVSFALGKALEDRGDYDAAFEHYAEGNQLKKLQTRYTTEQMHEEFEAQKRHCTAELFETRAGVGHDDPAPIFILGLPRAGSTLIEQILASHSQVDGTLELPNILSLAHRLRGRKQVSDRDRYPRVLHELPDEEFEKLGRDYIENTAIHRKGAPFFTDKMPNNFRHIGLIHMILPNAKIIDARREPMACCFSGFKQLFAEGQEFSYSLEDIGNYYRGYVDLMAHWDRVLPGKVLRVQHEDVVADLEGQVRRLLDYCGLPFEQACVDFHKTKRAVRTASSEQVRQPISASGLDQWRHFEDHLGPLKEALGPALETYSSQ
ncbi:tetratricopeptide repeat-containing sulfotransferase family protein [Henriciella mobilis]|uniref:Sulfotransferase family protein n=1 Tax=Henriciella mobilis TaxID=2305467 RepID=A0A399RD51_9PROT|nr:tetratricopeptide repeat-containing sulfotransferase family protein [Henriciella mobilis]RIJ27845.1 sulfotransferase family protein [Henriciella mobilis]